MMSISVEEARRSILPIIEKSAPIIASAIGGPVATVAGFAISLLAHAFGSDPTNIQDLADKMVNDDSRDEKLAEIEEKNGDLLTAPVQRISDIKMPSSAEITVKMEWKD